MRRYLIAGNWKMNTTASRAVELAREVAEAVPGPHIDVLVAPPFPYLIPVREALAGFSVWLAGQNCHEEAPGAFTGETAAVMLRDVGCSHVILGHSERRHGLGETDTRVNAKLHRALGEELQVILCIGELLEEREAGRTEEVLEAQLNGSLAGVSAEALRRVVIAYEPVWAIGTGQVATPDQAQDAHRFVRAWLAAQYGDDAAAQAVIQYGGSVKPENARDLLSQPDVDGALVGGASLKIDQFGPIMTAAANLAQAAAG